MGDWPRCVAPGFPFARHRLVLARCRVALALTLIAVAGLGESARTGSAARSRPQTRPRRTRRTRRTPPITRTPRSRRRRPRSPQRTRTSPLLNTQISALHVTIASDTATLHTVDARARERSRRTSPRTFASPTRAADPRRCSRTSSRPTRSPAAIQRDVQVNEISSASQQLVDAHRRRGDQGGEHARTAQRRARRSSPSAEEQAITAQAVIKVQEQNLLVADIAAHQQVSQAQKALAAPSRRSPPREHATRSTRRFQVRCSRSTPTSRCRAARPRRASNQFLAGSALAGLGASFMQAETTYHVSARYFVAHAILESGWGTSAIAQNKYNLFGFGADDANPYGDAMTFTSFDACIQYVAQFIESNYLTLDRPLLPRPDVARDERRLRERPQLGREDREHRRHDPADHRRPLSPIRRGTGTSGLRPFERTPRHR